MHTIGDFVGEFILLGIPVKPSFIQCIFAAWHWSWRKPVVQQIAKYTTANIWYYMEWVTLVPHRPLAALKFCDESHFTSCQLCNTCVAAPVGIQPYLTTSADLSDSFSLTLITDLSNPDNPFYVDLCAESNTEEDFVDFVEAAIQEGWFVVVIT